VPFSEDLLTPDVDVSWWATQTTYSEGWYSKVCEAVRDWAIGSFPFENPYFCNVETPG
jgi:hypothetical protein